MKYLENIKEAIEEVYIDNKYFYITFFSSLIIYSLNAIAHNLKLLINNFTPKLFFSMVAGFHHTMASYSIIFLIIISALSGILISMTYYLIKRQVNEGIVESGTGIVVSVIVPACSSCALGIVGLLGIGGLLTVLPFKGAEIGILGIVVVFLALASLSKKVVTKTCELK